LYRLPKNLGALDIFIGEKEYLKNNIGSQSIKQFFKDYNVPYSYIFVDTNIANISAIRSYEKAGFKKVNLQAKKREVGMLLDISQYHLKPLPSAIDKDILNYPLTATSNSNFLLKIISFWLYIWRRFKKSIHRINLWMINNNWHRSRNNNLYNPTLAATVYKWGTMWNIARYSMHYEGFQSKNEAMNAAFEMWRFEKENNSLPGKNGF